MAITFTLEPHRRTFFANVVGIGLPFCWKWLPVAGRRRDTKGPMMVVTLRGSRRRRSVTAAEAALYFFRGRVLSGSESIVHVCGCEDCIRPDHLAVRSA
jgi:hypothetical protein